MALPALLSAVKSLILDVRELPLEVEGRAKLYAEIFPALSDLEREDLALIDPSKLATYTTSIFVGEAGTLAAHFPCTFALLKSVWKKVYNAPWKAPQFARELHGKRPWKGTTTEILAQNLVTHLCEDRPELLEEIPYLHEVALLEITALQVKRAQGPQRKSQPSFQECSALSVEELLECKFIVSPTLKTISLTFDVVGPYQTFLKFDELPKQIERRAHHIVAARDDSGRVRWRELSESCILMFERVPKGAPLAIAVFAEAFLATRIQGRTEQELFGEFFHLLLAVSEEGILDLKI